MGFLDRRTISVLITILAFAGVIGLLWLARFPVISFIFAIFFAHLLEPVVGQFKTWFRVSRGKAVAITYLAILVLLLIFGFTVGPRVVQQAAILPVLLQNVQSGNIAWQLGDKQGWSRQTEARIQAWLVRHQSDMERWARDVTSRLQQFAANALWVLLVPVLAVFVLTDSSRLRSSAVEVIGHSRNREFLESVMDDLDTMLAQFVRAQLLLSLFAFIAYAVFLLIAGVPYAFGIAAIGGVLEFIPFVGPLLMLGILIGVAFLTGYSHWGVLVIFWLLWRGIQDYVNTPRVMGEGLDLHPLLAIFAILVGGEVAGVLGIFLSIPAVAALRILWLNWTGHSHARKAA